MGYYSRFPSFVFFQGVTNHETEEADGRHDAHADAVAQDFDPPREADRWGEHDIRARRMANLRGREINR